MPPIKGPVSLEELLLQGGDAFGDPEKLRCPHCGADAKAIKVITPKKGLELTYYAPPFGCCPRAPKRGS